jgi:hypothetical protein
MNERMSINTFCTRFRKGDFDNPDIHTQIEAGWYDWFCRDSSLKNKTKNLGNKIDQIKESKRFNPEKCYVFFKNNCPANGSLYDSFSICDLESGDVLFWVTPRNGHDIHRGKAQVFSSNDFENPAAEGSWLDIKKWFMEGNL